jgi:hypothetical protein
MENEEILAEFTEAGRTASYHYADDSCKEWDLGFKHSQKCKALWDAHPELHDQMRVIKRGFLIMVGD